MTVAIKELETIAQKVRCHIIEMTGKAGSGHPGGSLSGVEILTVLYFATMSINVANPEWPQRDRFVLSKGHASPLLYSILAEKGFFPVEDLGGFRKLGSPLQGHPDMVKVLGVDMSTGSLGQGLSTAVGMALGHQVDNTDAYVYALLGDGELQEGQNWEAAMAAAHYKLGRLIIFLDYNGLQIDGCITEVMNPEPLAAKWQAFGWHVQEIDGHNMLAIREALTQAKEIIQQPSIIIAQTTKGKGVSYMEDRCEWHGSAPSKEQVKQALDELQGGKANV